jgi:hypothetical protein
MRPAIDISNKVHGAVKDYADEHDLDLSEAYEEVLWKGLDCAGTPAEQ